MREPEQGEVDLGWGFGQQAQRMNGEGDMRLGDGKREANVEIKAEVLRRRC